ncbi:unnamed protein product [Brachionus calyciflorus]|uniref:Arginine-hydroxylase NDUFAF5, mitochondrial n=1 Tax=Brachionus calyciflorus TaxID=104777 RepID=A0A813MFR6_9BILA|nr:unnamed protein product [Brachionus calyciflorus]
MVLKLIKPVNKINIIKNSIKRDFNISNILAAKNRPIPSNLNIFDRETKKLQRNRTAYDPNYKDYEYIKSEVGYRVADRVFDIKRNFNSIIDLGCQRGYVSKNLTKETVKKVYMLEMSDKMLEQAEIPEEGIEVEKRVFDEEDDLPFENESIDLIISSLNLHWVNNLPKIFKESIRVLKKDCAIIGAMFAGDTLFELRVSLQLAELERKGGITPRVSPFTTPQDIGGLLTSSGFTLLTMDFDEIQISYPSIFELMYDLKGMGESNSLLKRQHNLSPDLLIAAQSIYKEMYGNEDGSLPATYQILYFIAWKPHESQAKPAKRGSANVSFKDLPKVLENKKDQE